MRNTEKKITNEKILTALTASFFALTVRFKGIHFLACLMLSKRDAPKGYVFVKAKGDADDPYDDIDYGPMTNDEFKPDPPQDKKKVKVLSADEKAKREAQARFRAQGRERFKAAREAKESEAPPEEEEPETQEPEEEPDDRPGHVKANEERQPQVQQMMFDHIEELLSFGATHEEALQDASQVIGEAFAESLGADADTDAFERQHDQTPFITPAMSAVFTTYADEQGLDTTPYEATVKDEQMFHHLGMLDQYKVKRPDKAMEALDWESGRDGEDVHPAFQAAGMAYNEASATGSFDLQDALDEESFRRRQRGYKVQDRADAESDEAEARDESNRRFEDVPPYDPLRDEQYYTESKSALDQAYQSMFEQHPVRTDDDDRDTFTPAKSATKDALIDTIQRMVETERRREQAGHEEENKRRESMGEEPVERKFSSDAYLTQKVYDQMQTVMNTHASKALNAIGVGGRQKLEFGRTNESGSDPIMTPTWKAIGNQLGIKTPIKVNAPDALLVGPFSGIAGLGGEPTNPFNPQYQAAIASAVAHHVDTNKRGMDNIHPAIKSNGDIMRTVFERTGIVDVAEESGLDTGREADRTDLDTQNRKAGSISTQEALGGGRAGTPMSSNLDALLGRDSKTKLIYGDVTQEDLAGMSKLGRRQFLERKARKHHRALKEFMRTGKGSLFTQAKKDKLAAFEHKVMMNEVEYNKRLLDAGRISRDEYNKEVGRIIALKGLENEEGDKTEEEEEMGQSLNIPDVPEGHYLYADRKTGEVLTPAQREKKLASFMQTILGTHHIVQAAKRRLNEAGQDAGLIHNEGDLLALMKPPSKRPYGPKTKQDTRVDAMTAANLDENWLKTRLTQNNELRENIRELGISPLAFLDQVAQAFGNGENYDSLNQGAIKMMNQMGSSSDLENDSINKMLFNFMRKRHTKEMSDMNHASKSIEQHKALREKKLGEGEHTCVNCVGSPERHGNIGDNRGGKGGIRSPYLYDLMKVPSLFGVPLGELGTEANGHMPLGRGVETSLVNIYHDMKGRGDEEEDWMRTDRDLANMDMNTIRYVIEQNALKRIGSATEDISSKYGVPARWTQARPKGIAADIERNPLAAETWKYAFPSTSGTERRDAHDNLQQLIKNQKKDILGAFNLLTMARRDLRTPLLYDGKMSSKGKRHMINDLVKASGHPAYRKAMKDYNKFANDRTIKRDGSDDKTILGHNTKMASWEGRMKFDEIENLNRRLQFIKQAAEELPNLQGMPEPQVKELLKKKYGLKAYAILGHMFYEDGEMRKPGDLKGQTKSMNGGLKRLRDKAAEYCKNSDSHGAYGVELNRYRKSKEKHNTLKEEVQLAQSKVKFPVDNNHIATLASLYPQISEMMKTQGKNPEEGRLSEAVDALHKDVYQEKNGMNKRHRFNFALDKAGRPKASREVSRSPLDAKGGLRGRIGETLGSAINYAGGGYHAPLPTNLDDALAMLREKGVDITPEIISDLTSAETALKTSEDIESEFKDDTVNMSERDKVKANRRYVHNDKKNYSNPTGSLSRCGTCGGNACLTKDELVAYAKAHNNELHGLTASSRAMRGWISQHGRPFEYQSFDSFNDANGCETSPQDHNEYACPDCQHWDNQVNGYVSDGICGSCLGHGTVDQNDEHLLEHIEHHPHKVGTAMDAEKIAKIANMSRIRQMGEDVDDVDDVEPITDPSRLLSGPPRTGSDMGDNIINDMFSSDSIRPLDLLLGRIEDGELPDIHTREDLERAKAAIENKQRTSNILSGLKHLHADDEEGKKGKGKDEFGQGKVIEPIPIRSNPQQRLPGLGMPSMVLRDARQKAGRQSLEKQIKNIKKMAKRFGLHKKATKDENGVETGTLYDSLEKKCNRLLAHHYAAFDDDNHEVHDLFHDVQVMLTNETNKKSEQRDLLSQGTSMLEQIEKMPAGEDKDKAMKKYMNSMYRTPSWTTPLLSHKGGRVVTQWEDMHEDAFDSFGSVDIAHYKTPERVRNFFKSGKDERRNRIESAFNMLSSKTWEEIKEEEDGQIMSFLKDFDELIESGEKPLMVSQGGKLKPNMNYLEMRELTGAKTADDDYIKDLPKGNVLHPNLDKHSDNAQNWLRTSKKITNDDGTKSDVLRGKKDALHMVIPTAISDVAMNEHKEMAKMRAKIAFFKIQNLPGQDHMLPDIEKILNKDGEPMTIEDYAQGGLNREQQSQLDANIAKMIVDRNGNPIEDIDEKDVLNNYHIINRMPHSESHNQDLALEKFSFEDYFDERKQDADLNAVAPASDDNTFINKVMNVIASNQQLRETKHDDKFNMSYNDAQQIVDNANNFFDMYHFPNLYLENKMHDMAEQYGLDNLTDLKQLFDQDPELKKEFIGDVQMIKSIHPSWMPTNTAQQREIDIANGLGKVATQQQRFGYDKDDESGLALPTPGPSATNQGPRTKEDVDAEKKAFAERMMNATKQHITGETPQTVRVHGPITQQQDMDDRYAEYDKRQKEMVQVRQAQQEAAQQPGQTAFLQNPPQPMRQDATNQEGQQTGFVQVVNPLTQPNPRQNNQ